jgi:hypothetical protein
LRRTGREQDDPWRRFVEQLPDCERYAEAAGREISVVILEPTTEEACA